MQVKIPVAIHMRKRQARGGEAGKLRLDFRANRAAVRGGQGIGPPQAHGPRRQNATGINQFSKRGARRRGAVYGSYVQPHGKRRGLPAQFNGVFPCAGIYH